MVRPVALPVMKVPKRTELMGNDRTTTTTPLLLPCALMPSCEWVVYNCLIRNLQYLHSVCPLSIDQVREFSVVVKTQPREPLSADQ
jgi:hypothetical protein